MHTHRRGPISQSSECSTAFSLSRGRTPVTQPVLGQPSVWVGDTSEGGKQISIHGSSVPRSLQLLQLALAMNDGGITKGFHGALTSVPVVESSITRVLQHMRQSFCSVPPTAPPRSNDTWWQDLLPTRRRRGVGLIMSSTSLAGTRSQMVPFACA